MKFFQRLKSSVKCLRKNVSVRGSSRAVLRQEGGCLKTARRESEPEGDEVREAIQLSDTGLCGPL